MENIYQFQDFKSGIDPVLNYEHGKTGQAIVIDNGKKMF